MFEELDALPFAKSLGSDNHSGVHPLILEAVLKANRGHAHSYGMDPLSQETEQEFERVFGKKGFVHFVFNGTAANVLCLAATLKRYEAVACSEQAHLQLDECGAPEITGHTKLIPLASRDGKITPDQLLPHLHRQGDQHHMQIKMVSLTQPTELGVIYTLEELKTWKEFCQTQGFYLHCDGTRLSNSCVTAGISLKEYGEIFDLISFGGTKNGLLGAEAVVHFRAEWAQDMKFLRKQLLHLPSKSRFLAAQFYAYLKNDLYLDIAREVCAQAKRLKEELEQIPEITVIHPVQSNAVFARIPKAWLKEIRAQNFFYVWDPQESIVRLMCGFDWTQEDTETFIQKIKEVRKHHELS
jgi:threonine aldolase